MASEAEIEAAFAVIVSEMDELKEFLLSSETRRHLEDAKWALDFLRVQMINYRKVKDAGRF